MDGPQLLARSLSLPFVEDRRGNLWQYHPRSDHHSKVACWGILFDLLQECPLLVEHVRAGRVAFGINHQMRDFKNNRNKKLDLVICSPGAGQTQERTLRTFVEDWNLQLRGAEWSKLEELPTIVERPVGEVRIALEAKAAMTAHIRARPRLHSELEASHLTVHGASSYAIAAGFVMVNIADEFISPDLNKHDMGVQPPVVSKHKQPSDAQRVITTVEQLARRSNTAERGFDAIGICVVDCRNDGEKRVTLVETRPAPQPNSAFHYDSMIRRLAHLYAARFPHE